MTARAGGSYNTLVDLVTSRNQSRGAEPVSQPSTEPRNPFYLLLLLASLLFVITALAYTIVPTLEERARAAGADVPSSEIRKALKAEGHWWLLYEVAVMIVLGLCSMGLDRLRRLQNERKAATITPTNHSPGTSPEATSVSAATQSGESS
jgi:hypothetical protein